MFVFTSPRYQQVEPTGKVPVPGGMQGSKGPETETGEACEPQRGQSQQLLSGMMGTFPCPQRSPTVGPNFPPQSCLHYPKRVQLTLHQLAAT